VPCLYQYSPINNQYSKIVCNLSLNKYKGLLKHKNKVFLLNDNKIFESKNKDLTIWACVGLFQYPETWFIKDYIETERSIFFHNGTNLFKMEVDSNTVECLIDYDYSKRLQEI
jgi:hypothetical protein